MKKIVEYLQSKDAVFHGSLSLMFLYVPHAAHLFKQLEHLNMELFGLNFLNWFYAIALAATIEFLILIFIINGYKKTGQFYAVVSFFLNVFYYDYLFTAMQIPDADNVKTACISFCICLIHSLAVWQLSELFLNRLKEEKDKLSDWCSECGAGPFLNKRSLDGHISKAHKGKKKEAANSISVQSESELTDSMS